MYFWSQELPSVKIIFQRFYFTLLQCFLAFCWLNNLLVIHTVLVGFFFSTLRDYTGVKQNSSKVSSHFRKVNECYKVNGVEEKTISPTSAPKLPPKHFVSISRENQHSGHVTAPLILKRLVVNLCSGAGWLLWLFIEAKKTATRDIPQLQTLMTFNQLYLD